MTNYQENRILVFKGKIKTIRKTHDYMRKNLPKYILFLVCFSFYVPFAGGRTRIGGKRANVLELCGGNYWYAYFFSLMCFMIMVLLGVIIFSLQERYRIQKLKKRLEKIYKDIEQGVSSSHY